MNGDFRDVAGAPGYKINSEGVVLSKSKRRVHVMQGRSLRTGHVLMMLQTPEGPKGRYVHRLVAEAFLPAEVGRTVVDHIDGNPRNNRLENLRWVTQGENVRFSVERRRRLGFWLDGKKEPIRAIGPDGVEHDFDSIATAVKWLHGFGYSDKRGTAVNISRARDRQKKAYGFRWERLDKDVLPRFKQADVIEPTAENVRLLKRALDEATAQIIFLKKTVPEIAASLKPIQERAAV